MIPYIGADPRHKAGKPTRNYGGDLETKRVTTQINAADPRHDPSGDWIYEMNSLGFRGPEFNDKAKFSIYVSGCSDTVGEGVRFEQSWPWYLADSFAQASGEKFELLNMGQSGAPNDYISRMAVAQIFARSPSLLVVVFSKSTRKEILEGNEIYHIGPWHNDERALTYYAAYSEENGIADTLRHILVIQSACRSLAIPYVIGSVEYRQLLSVKSHGNPVINSLASLIAWELFLPFSPHTFEIDKGRDGIHPGPCSHEAFARELFSFIKRAYRIV